MHQLTLVPETLLRSRSRRHYYIFRIKTLTGGFMRERERKEGVVGGQYSNGIHCEVTAIIDMRNQSGRNFVKEIVSGLRCIQCRPLFVTVNDGKGCERGYGVRLHDSGMKIKFETAAGLL